MFEIEGVGGDGSGALDALTAAIDVLLATDPRDASLVDTVGDIAELHTQMNRLDVVMLARVSVVDADSGHQLAGYATTGAPCSPTGCGVADREPATVDSSE